MGGRRKMVGAAVALLLTVGASACGGGGEEVRAAGVGPEPPADALATRSLILEGDDLVDLRASAARGGVAEVPVGALAEEPWSMVGLVAPRAVPLADGTLYYAAVEDEVRLDNARADSEQGVFPGSELGTPVVRRSTAAGDELVARGALSFAVRDDHALAFNRGKDPATRRSDPYVGDIVVRDAVGKERVVSPRTAQWNVRAWAGDHLVVYDDWVDREGGKFFLLNPATKALVALPDGVPVAVSESGTQILVASGPVLPEAEAEAGVLHLFEVASGRVTSTITAGEVRALGVEMLSDQWGDWSGTTAALVAAPDPLLLTIDEKSLTLAGTVDVDAPKDGWITQVTLTDDTGIGVIALVNRNDYEDSAGALIAQVQACDETGCTVLRDGGGRRQDLSLAYNPSSSEGR